MNYNTYRTQIRKEMLISEVRNNEVRRRVTILPQEVDALAKQVGAQNGSGTELNLSHILIPLPENPTQQQVDGKPAKRRRVPAGGSSWRVKAVPISASWRSPTPPTSRR